MTDFILCDELNPVATIVIHNPDKRNALNRAAWGQLAVMVRKMDARGDVRCIVIRGDGDKAFAAGADISEFPENRANAEQAQAYGEDVSDALNALRGCRHPVIAMIHGACTGGGLEIASCCDLRIAGESARLGVPIKRIGHAFAPAEMKPVLDLAGPALVLELLLEGRILGAEEALFRGLVNRVVPDERLADEVATAAGRIASGAPLAARMTKKLLHRLLDGTPMSEDEVREVYGVCDSRDYAEGVRAFLAKQQPAFEGR